MIGKLLNLSVTTIQNGKQVTPTENGMPFVPMRVFYMYECDSESVRGRHAHRDLQQMFICVRGSCSVMLDDSKNKSEYRLESAEVGLHVPSMIWGEISDFSEGAVLLVLASAPYDADDYIHDYDEFVTAA